MRALLAWCGRRRLQERKSIRSDVRIAERFFRPMKASIPVAGISARASIVTWKKRPGSIARHADGLDA